MPPKRKQKEPVQQQQQQQQHEDGPSTSEKPSAKSYWLMKSEPSEFSWDNLSQLPDQTSSWEGVRNPQARNSMRAMKVDDEAFFYHSNCKTPMIVGIIKVVRTAYPDHSAYDKKSEYYDASSTPEKPKWWMVDVKRVREMTPVSLETIKRAAAGGSDAQPAKKKQKKGVQEEEQGEHVTTKSNATGANSSILSSMELLNRSRLSVQRVSPEQWQAVLALEQGS